MPNADSTNNQNGSVTWNNVDSHLTLSTRPMIKAKQLNAFALIANNTVIAYDGFYNTTNLTVAVEKWNSLPAEIRKNPTIIGIVIRGSQYYSENARVSVTYANLISRCNALIALMKIKLGDEKQTSLLTWIGRNYRLVNQNCTYNSQRMIEYINAPELEMAVAKYSKQSYAVNTPAMMDEIALNHSNTVTAARWFERINSHRVHQQMHRDNATAVRTLPERFNRIVSNIVSTRPHQWMRSLDSTSLAIANRMRPSGECLGIELEFVAEKDSPIVQWDSCDYPKHHWLFFKGDGSIRPNISSETLAQYQELTWFINGSSPSDWDKMEAVLKQMTANGAKVNNSCGNHVHIDMRHRTSQSAMRTATKVRDAINTWAHRAVSFNRSHNNYCGIDREHQGNRYTAVNTQCLSEHNTIEVRLGMPTLNYYKLKYWSAFMQYLAKPYTSVSTLEEFMESDASIGLKHYVFKRILKFESTYLNNNISPLVGFDTYTKAFNAIDNGVE